MEASLYRAVLQSILGIVRHEYRLANAAAWSGGNMRRRQDPQISVNAWSFCDDQSSLPSVSANPSI
jgi:hypothetical protein